MPNINHIDVCSKEAFALLLHEVMQLYLNHPLSAVDQLLAGWGWGCFRFSGSPLKFSFYCGMCSTHFGFLCTLLGPHCLGILILNGAENVLHSWFLILPADINECEEFGICPQSCRNSKGSYECFCVDGFKSMSTHYGERCAADGTMGPCLEQVT